MKEARLFLKSRASDGFELIVEFERMYFD